MVGRCHLAEGQVDYRGGTLILSHAGTYSILNAGPQWSLLAICSAAIPNKRTSRSDHVSMEIVFFLENFYTRASMRQP